MSKNIPPQIYWFIIGLSRSNKVFRFLIDWAALVFYRVTRGRKTFNFQGKMYRYFYHIYNRTVAGERVVEVPVVYEKVKSYRGKEILEVGNVLSHYFPIKHDILDKYEKAPGVINEDVITFNPKKKYDLIVSISTLEHVGWSFPEAKETKKTLNAIRKLKKMLKKSGLIMVTFPLFFRKDLTNLIKERKIPLEKIFFMKRTSFLNDWKEVSFKEAMKGSFYDSYYANANILFIGMSGGEVLQKEKKT